MKVIIAGDFAPVYHRLKKAIDNGDYSSVFGDIKPVLAEYDYSIVNFEAPVADISSDRPIVKNGPNIFASNNALEAIKWCGFNLITLANNHILDYGGSALCRTLSNAKSLGIDTVGAGANLSDAATIHYADIDGQRLAIINCCEHEFSIATDTSCGANPLNPVDQYNKIREARQNADYVLVIVHGGHEYFQLPSPRMQDTYRFFIDVGADAVVNHHQHCFSGYEIYNSRPIFYGLGNFCFDKSSLYKTDLWTKGFLVGLDFSASGVTHSIIPYTQCDSSPKVSLLADKNMFNTEISRLNEIIKSRNQLEKSVSDYYSQSMQSVIDTFEPYNLHILQAALSRGFLPRFIKGKKISMIRNLVNCESHLDRLRYVLNNMHQTGKK